MQQAQTKLQGILKDLCMAGVLKSNVPSDHQG